MNSSSSLSLTQRLCQQQSIEQGSRTAWSTASQIKPTSDDQRPHAHLMTKDHVKLTKKEAMPTLNDHRDVKTSSQHWTRKQHTSTTSGLALHFIFHRFSSLNCCLCVVLQLDKGDYPENSRVVFCPDKQRSFEPFFPPCVWIFLATTVAISLVLDFYVEETSPFFFLRRPTK